MSIPGVSKIVDPDRLRKIHVGGNKNIEKL